MNQSHDWHGETVPACDPAPARVPPPAKTPPPPPSGPMLSAARLRVVRWIFQPEQHPLPASVLSAPLPSDLADNRRLALLQWCFDPDAVPLPPDAYADLARAGVDDARRRRRTQRRQGWSGRAGNPAALPHPLPAAVRDALPAEEPGKGDRS